MPGLPFPKGTILADKYRVDQVIGEGGMGLVLSATHLQLDELVAIKILHVEASLEATAIARFVREARAASRVKSEHVVRILDVSSLPTGQPYIVMEHLEGADLGQLLERSGQLPIEDVLDYVLQASEALAEAHALGIIHRDLKPANLFVTRRADGSPLVKVLDFGISKVAAKPGAFHASLTGTAEMMGSPLYMSPEQMRANRDVDQRADVWAIGVILHELLSGASPFMQSSFPQICAMIIADPPPSLRSRRPDVPSELESVIVRCLAKEPSDRFQNVAELAAALRPFAPARSQLSIERVSRITGAAVPPHDKKTLPLVGAPPVPTTSALLGMPGTTGTAHTLSTAKFVAPKRVAWIAVAVMAIMIGLATVLMLAIHSRPGRTLAAAPETSAAPAVTSAPPSASIVAVEAPPASAAPSVEPPRPAASAITLPKPRPAPAKGRPLPFGPRD